MEELGALPRMQKVSQEKHLFHCAVKCGEEAMSTKVQIREMYRKYIKERSTNRVQDKHFDDFVKRNVDYSQRK